MGLQNGFDKVAMNKLPLLVIQDIGKNMELEDRLSFMVSIFKIIILNYSILSTLVFKLLFILAF